MSQSAGRARGLGEQTPHPCPGDKCVEHGMLPRPHGLHCYFQFSHVTQATRTWGDPIIAVLGTELVVGTKQGRGWGEGGG